MSSCRFTAATSEIFIGDWNPVDLQSLTIGLWVYVHDFGAPHATDARFISKASGVGSNEHDWMVGQIFSGNQKWRIRLRAGGTTDTFVSTELMETDQWYLAIAQYDGTKVSLWVNNVITTIDTNHSVGGDINSSNKNIYIGNNAGDNKGPNASIGELFVLSGVFLNESQRTRLFQGATIREVTTHGIQAYFKMDGSTHVQDLSGLSDNITRHGVALATRAGGPIPKVDAREMIFRKPFFPLMETIGGGAVIPALDEGMLTGGLQPVLGGIA